MKTLNKNNEVIPNRFDFEQQILKCWNVTDDINELTARFVDDEEFDTDKFCNHAQGLVEIYDYKFQKLWELFEQHIKAIDIGVKELEK